ncbi:hypothetical protein CPT_Moonbeam14 [Bacillus phage Moonbeam]|uniref:Uncharacterized protein n=1 Tax=Bacillus phage Moonbeam TaxID=1540091 RepID=A0A0A0RN21_9CAUD|nr:hypothetical protein CPT_Moonbeam14 [Bacillus phage Moonbeam]AIW03412.1 hypothetical protein CPT_Moonbeam14 [Bacillus phage Moonbeam]
MREPAEKHFRITYIKRVNMIGPTVVAHKEDYALDDLQDVLDRYKDLSAKDNVTSLGISTVEIYPVDPQELL